MIHIVFQEADAAILTKSFDLDESLRGLVLLFRDDLAVGPIKDLHTEEGNSRREQWWKSVLENSTYDGFSQEYPINDEHTFSKLTAILKEDPQEEVWIWAAQNAHDVCGYFWLITQLKSFAGRIFILYLNNLPFINEKGHLFYPMNLFEIQPREFLKARKLARLVTPSEFEIDPDEWTRLSSEDKGVRILEGGKKLQQFGEDYFDKELLQFITMDWQKVHKIVHNFLSKKKPPTGEAFLLWRLRLMITAAVLDSQGDPKNPKDFEVKLKPGIEIAGN